MLTEAVVDTHHGSGFFLDIADGRLRLVGRLFKGRSPSAPASLDIFSLLFEDMAMPVIHSQYRESGTVKIDDATCKRCGLCVRICPADVLAIESGRLCVRDDSLFGCIACGHCMMVCPDGSIAVTGRGVSLDDLLPLPAPGEKATVEALEALMRSRRSIRHFNDRDVDQETLDRVLEMAATAPMGIPPWDIGCVTVLGRKNVCELASQIINGYEGFLKLFKPWVLRLMRPMMGRAKYEQFHGFIRPLAEMYVGHWREGRDVLFHAAPAVLLFHHSPYSDTPEAMIACTYAMLAAESLGLGTTMIGGAAPILQRNGRLCRELGIPKGNTPAIALIVGYPDVEFKRTIHRRFSNTETVD